MKNKFITTLLFAATWPSHATPTFTWEHSGSTIYIYASNSSASMYSCQLTFDWAYWGWNGYITHGNCPDNYYDNYLDEIKFRDSCYAKLLGKPKQDITVIVLGSKQNQLVSQVTNAGVFYGGTEIHPSVFGKIYTSCKDARQPQTITFERPPDIKVGDTVQLRVTGGASGNPVSLSSLTTIVCSVSGKIATGKAGGSCSIKAFQKGNEQYLDATVTKTFTVKKLSQSIDIQAPSFIPIGGRSIVSGTSSAGLLPITFSSNNNAICTVTNSGEVVGVAKGTCRINLKQSGNYAYSEASASASINIDNAGVITPAIHMLLEE